MNISKFSDSRRFQFGTAAALTALADKTMKVNSAKRCMDFAVIAKALNNSADHAT